MPESAITGQNEPSWWEIRSPTGPECDSTGASPDGVIVLHKGEIIAHQDEYGTITLCIEWTESDKRGARKRTLERVLAGLMTLSEIAPE